VILALLLLFSFSSEEKFATGPGTILDHPWNHLVSEWNSPRMASHLERIVAQRRQDVEALLLELSVSSKASWETGGYSPGDLFLQVRAHRAAKDTLFVAAEFKRASPSKGEIAPDLDAFQQAKVYAESGAGLVSVLTEPKWFKGSLRDLELARKAVEHVQVDAHATRPLVLMKDFVVHEVQLQLARKHGADSVLLMLSVLKEEEVKTLLQKARKLGMEPLVEVVNEEETNAALRAGARVIGVNNRNLHTFQVDMETTPRVVEVVRKAGKLDEVVIIALSGIKVREDVKKYEEYGSIDGLLIGETLMRAPDPKEMIAQLLHDDPEEQYAPIVPRVKICGINSVEAALTAAKAGADFIGIIFVVKSVRSASEETAKEIVKAIRAYRERDGRVEFDVPKKTDSGPGSWYRTWSKSYGSTCDGAARPLLVGVFMGHSVQEVNRIANNTGIDLIQLHGKENSRFEAECILPVIRVVHVDATATMDGKSPIAEESLVDGPASFLLLDTSLKGGASGGTGKTFDWKIAKDLAENRNLPVIMAGGLTPENVAEAVQAARPWGVDVASGVEERPGVKDFARIVAFVKEAKKTQQPK